MTDVDIDRLADFLGGVLSGADEAEVARLVADDASWRAAYELLAPGMTAVTADLADLPAEPMPDDVVARVDAALADARPPLTLVSGDGRSRPRRARRLRWAAPIAVAAGVLAFAGFGATYLGETMTQSDDSAASSAGGGAERALNAPAPAAARPDGGITDDQVTASGANFDTATLKQSDAATMAAPATKASSPSQPQEARRGVLDAQGAAAVPAELRRLQSRAALEACIKAITDQVGSLELRNVDFARYLGSPALIVRFTSGGAGQVWAVGPACGSPGVGADPQVQLQVG